MPLSIKALGEKYFFLKLALLQYRLTRYSTYSIYELSSATPISVEHIYIYIYTPCLFLGGRASQSFALIKSPLLNTELIQLSVQHSIKLMLDHKNTSQCCFSKLRAKHCKHRASLIFERAIHKNNKLTAGQQVPR